MRTISNLSTVLPTSRWRMTWTTSRPCVDVAMTSRPRGNHEHRIIWKAGCLETCTSGLGLGSGCNSPAYTTAESAGGLGNDRGPLFGARPASVCGCGRAVSRRVPIRAGIIGGDLPQRRDRPWAKPVAVGASALSPGGKRSDDGKTSRLAWPAVGGPACRAELVAGRGDFVPAKTLGASDTVLARGRTRRWTTTSASGR